MQPTIAFGFLALLQCSDGSDFSTDAVNTFFTQFSTLRFLKATHLWLELFADTPSQLWRPFLERFPTVQTMLISIRDIGLFEIFTQLLVQTRVLPSLQIIKLRPGAQFHPIHLKHNEMEVIAVFKVGWGWLWCSANGLHPREQDATRHAWKSVSKGVRSATVSVSDHCSDTGTEVLA